MDRIDERNRALADTGEPVFALAAILERRGKEARDRLKQLTGADNLYAWMTDAKNLSMLLMALPAADYALFARAAEGPFLQEKEVFLPMHSGLIGFCLLQPYLVGEELYLVVPTEIRTLWQDLKRSDLPRRKQLHDTLDAYAQAAVKLYGVLFLADFGEMLRLRTEVRWNEETEAMLRSLADGTYYEIEGDLLLHRGLSAEEAKAYLTAREGLPRYLPVHEKILRLGDGDYYDVFHALEVWRLEAEDAFREAGEEDAEEKATAFSDTLYAVLRMELKQEDHSRLFAEFGLEPDEARAAEIKMQVRLWCLGGNTPSELLAELEAGKLKPRVNGPCICGSGKKFKKCHGASPSAGKVGIAADGDAG